MKTITSTAFGITDVFEIVEKIPSGFYVWNIGDNMKHDDYIPLACDLFPDDKNDYTIDRDNLKAIHLTPEKVMRLRRAASYGIGNLKKCESVLKSKRSGGMMTRKKELAKDAIDIFREIDGGK